MIKKKLIALSIATTLTLQCFPTSAVAAWANNSIASLEDITTQKNAVDMNRTVDSNGYIASDSQATQEPLVFYQDMPNAEPCFLCLKGFSVS